MHIYKGLIKEFSNWLGKSGFHLIVIEHCPASVPLNYSSDFEFLSRGHNKSHWTYKSRLVNCGSL